MDGIPPAIFEGNLDVIPPLLSKSKSDLRSRPSSQTFEQGQLISIFFAQSLVLGNFEELGVSLAHPSPLGVDLPHRRVGPVAGRVVKQDVVAEGPRPGEVVPELLPCLSPPVPLQLPYLPVTIAALLWVVERLRLDVREYAGVAVRFVLRVLTEDGLLLLIRQRGEQAVAQVGVLRCPVSIRSPPVSLRHLPRLDHRPVSQELVLGGVPRLLDLVEVDVHRLHALDVVPGFPRPLSFLQVDIGVDQTLSLSRWNLIPLVETERAGLLVGDISPALSRVDLSLAETQTRGHAPNRRGLLVEVPRP